MNDFDKIFSDKLHHYKSTPPANGWEQLNAALDKEQRAKKKIIFWRVAAAILLLAVAGTSWWISTNPRKTMIADQTSVETNVLVEVEEKPNPDSGQLALEESVNNDQTEKLASVSSKAQTEEPAVFAEDEDHKHKKVTTEKRQLQHTPKVSTNVALATEESSDSTALLPGKSIQTIETLAVQPLGLVESELVAMEALPTKVSPPVTIIYKPGAQSLENEGKNVALEFLSELRNANISFSEIRNAKTELLAKVFSKKENEVTP